MQANLVFLLDVGGRFDPRDQAALPDLDLSFISVPTNTRDSTFPGSCFVPS